MGDGDLARRAREGDIDAYEELVRQHQDIAHRAAYLVTGNAAEAEDAVQEAFVRAYYALDSFDPERPFRPWLLRIVTNEAHNRTRSVARHARLASRARQHDTARYDPSAETLVLAHEGSAELITALNNLPDLDRLLVAYRYFLDLTPTEMAETFGKPAGTIRSRLHRALEKLRVELSDSRSSTSDGLKGTLHG